MKFSFTVDSAREASYVMSMFGALHAAMTEQPPPAIRSRTETYTVDGCSKSVSTEYTSAVSDKEPVPTPHPFTDAKAAEAKALHLHSVSTTSSIPFSLGDTMGGGSSSAIAADEEVRKKRGRKSNAEKEAAAAARKALEENALRPGEALKGVDAQSLAQALEGLPLVFRGGGVEMRVEPGTSEEEIAGIRARLAAVDTTREDHAAQAEARVDQLVQQTPAETRSDVMDDDLAALFRKPAAPPQEAAPSVSRFAGMDRGALMSEFKAYINTPGGGLFWARSVMGHFKLEALDDMKDEHIRHALENPNQFPRSDKQSA